MKRVLAVLFALFILTLATYANATVQSYLTKSDFIAAIGTAQTFDFNAPSGTPVTGLGPDIAVSTVGGDPNGVVNGNALCGSSGGGVDCFKPLLFTFTGNIYAFGFDDGDLTTDEEFVAKFTFQGGGVNHTFIMNLMGQPAFTPTFLGLTSTDPIATVEIYSRDPGSDLIGGRANTVIDVVIPGTSTQTPEPASLLLLAAGFASLISLRKRL